MWLELWLTIGWIKSVPVSFLDFMTAHFIFWSKFEGSVNWLNPVSIKFPIPIFQEQGYTGQGLDQTLDRTEPRAGRAWPRWTELESSGPWKFEFEKNDIELFSAKFVWNINYLNPEDPTEPIRCCQFKIFNHNHFKKSVQDFQQRVFFERV